MDALISTRAQISVVITIYAARGFIKICVKKIMVMVRDVHLGCVGRLDLNTFQLTRARVRIKWMLHAGSPRVSGLRGC